MPTRRHLLAIAGTAAAVALAGCTGGDGNGGDGSGDGNGNGEGDGDTQSPPRETGAAPDLSSPAFDPGGAIPTTYTCDGEDVSPPLSVSGVPDGAASLALVLDDPDAPRDEPFVHWLLWNLPPDTAEIPENVPPGERVDALGAAVQGTNSFGNVGYGGPCPPEADDAHTYRFVLHALDTELDLSPGARRPKLDGAMEGHVLGRTTLPGEYDR